MDERDSVEAQIREDRKLTQKLCGVEEGLTQWEMGFADSVDRWVESGRRLTPAQRTKIDEILRRVSEL